MNGEQSHDGMVTRRAMLKVAGASIAFGVAGTGFVGGSAAAAGDGLCPKSVAFWSSHEWPEGRFESQDTEIVTLAGVSRTASEWRTFLLTRTEDPSHLLAKQLHATMNNFYYRLGTDFGCANQIPRAFMDTPLEGKTIEKVKNMGITWLHHSNWANTFDGEPQDGWEIPIHNREYQGAVLDGKLIHDALQTFNTNGFEDVDCGCDAGTEIEIARVSVEEPGSTANVSEIPDDPPAGIVELDIPYI